MIFPDDFVDKLIVGDCLEIMKQIPDNSIDLIVTSPPYNKHATNTKYHTSGAWKNYKIDYGVFKDDMPEAEYQEWQKQG